MSLTIKRMRSGKNFVNKLVPSKKKIHYCHSHINQCLIKAPNQMGVEKWVGKNVDDDADALWPHFSELGLSCDNLFPYHRLLFGMSFPQWDNFPPKHFFGDSVRKNNENINVALSIWQIIHVKATERKLPFDGNCIISRQMKAFGRGAKCTPIIST